MKNKIGKSIVPCDALAPLIREWLTRNGYSIEPKWCENDQCGGLAALSFSSKVPTRRLTAILNEASRDSVNVSFDVADRLLCAMHMVGEWHHSLKEYYQDEIEVAPYEKHLVETEVAA